MEVIKSWYLIEKLSKECWIKSSPNRKIEMDFRPCFLIFMGVISLRNSPTRWAQVKAMTMRAKSLEILSGSVICVFSISKPLDFMHPKKVSIAHLLRYISIVFAFEKSETTIQYSPSTRVPVTNKRTPQISKGSFIEIALISFRHRKEVFMDRFFPRLTIWKFSLIRITKEIFFCFSHKNHFFPMNSRSANKCSIWWFGISLRIFSITLIRSFVLEFPCLSNNIHATGKAIFLYTIPTVRIFIFAFPNFQFVRSIESV